MRLFIIVVFLFASAVATLGFTAGEPEPVAAGGTPAVTQPSLADQLVAVLKSEGLDGMATISKIGFGGDAGTRWREALEGAGMPDVKINQALVLVDALISKSQTDAKMLTSSGTPKPLPVKSKTPAVKSPVSSKSPASSTAPTALASAESDMAPSGTTTGWAAAEIVTPSQLRAGDIIAVNSGYQFVLHQEAVSAASPLPDAPTFWRMGIVFRVEPESERFGLSMDYAAARKERSAWTVVSFGECLEIRRFGNVPYPVR